MLASRLRRFLPQLLWQSTSLRPQPPKLFQALSQLLQIFGCFLRFLCHRFGLLLPCRTYQEFLTHVTQPYRKDTVYLSLLTGILSALVPNKDAPNALYAQGVNFQVLVAEDAALDAMIQSEDPSNDLIYIPGFSSALQAESFQDRPLVWFPILGEGKVSQLEKVMHQVIPPDAEICPVLPHPSRDPLDAPTGFSDSIANRSLTREKLQRPTFFWPTRGIHLKRTDSSLAQWSGTKPACP